MTEWVKISPQVLLGGSNKCLVLGWVGRNPTFGTLYTSEKSINTFKLLEHNVVLKLGSTFLLQLHPYILEL